MGSFRPQKSQQSNYGHLRPTEGPLRPTWSLSGGPKTFQADRGLFKRKESPLVLRRAHQTNTRPFKAAERITGGSQHGLLSTRIVPTCTHDSL